MWALRTTASVSQMQSCQGVCDVMQKGSEFDCVGAHLYSKLLEDVMTANVLYFLNLRSVLFTVTYEAGKMKRCLSCARSNIDPLVMRDKERETHFTGVISEDYDFSN